MSHKPNLFSAEFQAFLAVGTTFEWGMAQKVDGVCRVPRLQDWVRTDAVATLLKNLMAYGAAEFSVRAVRLITVIVMARHLQPEVLGIAALSLTLFELIRVLANVGVGQLIIATPADQLASVCDAAHRLFWKWCAGVALVQLSGAVVLALMLDQIMAAQMLAVLALVYLMMPGGLVQCYLLMREGHAGLTARTAAIQTISDHVLTMTLLLIWQSPWSIILPKLITAPLWLILTRRAHVWRPTAGSQAIPVRGLLRYGLPILASEMLTTMRGQLDKIIIAATLGVSALGTYFFAFNAGIGILSSLITAFGTVIFPALCAEKKGKARQAKLKMIIIMGCMIFLPLIFAQSVLASFYVPLIFGAHWAHAVPLISILCLAGFPLLIVAIVTAWLRAQGRSATDAKLSALSCVLSLGGLWIGTQTGVLTWAAALWVSGLCLSILPFAIHVVRKTNAGPLPLPSQETVS